MDHDQPPLYFASRLLKANSKLVDQNGQKTGACLAIVDGKSSLKATALLVISIHILTSTEVSPKSFKSRLLGAD